MAYIDWDERYSVGVQELDEHHSKLVDLINALHVASRDGRTDTIIALVDELLRYTHFHFAAEEALLEKHGYPTLSEHQARHKDLLEELDDIQNKVEGGAAEMSMRLVDYLSNWVLQHVQGMDAQYSSFLNERGVS